MSRSGDWMIDRMNEEAAVNWPDDQQPESKTADYCKLYWACIGCPKVDKCEAAAEVFGEDV